MVCLDRKQGHVTFLKNYLLEGSHSKTGLGIFIITDNLLITSLLPLVNQGQSTPLTTELLPLDDYIIIKEQKHILFLSLNHYVYD